MDKPRPPLDLRSVSLLMRFTRDVSLSKTDDPCEFCSTAVLVNESPPPRCICDTDWKRRRLAAEKVVKNGYLAPKKKEVTARENLEPVRSVYDTFPDAVYDLLNKLLKVDPTARLTAEQALDHPFFD